MASDSTRLLILLRHAKADRPDVPDLKRPLATRGRREAPAAGRWLREHGYVPDVVICSPACRTRQTWELMAAELGGSPLVRFDPRAYDAGKMSLLGLARELPGRHRSALLVGHNPAVADLAGALAAAPGQPPPRMGFRTAAVAVFEFDGSWPGLAPGQARLLDFAVPAEM